jgi:hypothetical protein
MRRGGSVKGRLSSRRVSAGSPATFYLVVVCVLTKDRCSVQICAMMNAERRVVLGHDIARLGGEVSGGMNRQGNTGPVSAPSAGTGSFETTAQHGWAGTLATFVEADPWQVLAALQRFIPDAGAPDLPP